MLYNTEIQRYIERYLQRFLTFLNSFYSFIKYNALIGLGKNNKIYIYFKYYLRLELELKRVLLLDILAQDLKKNRDEKVLELNDCPQ